MIIFFILIQIQIENGMNFMPKYFFKVAEMS